MDQEIRKFLKEQGGVMSVNELADLLELDEGKIRKWARANQCRRIGSTYVFGKEAAFSCADDLLSADADEGDDDDDDLDDDAADQDEDGTDEEDEHDDDDDD